MFSHLFRKKRTVFCTSSLKSRTNWSFCFCRVKFAKEEEDDKVQDNSLLVELEEKDEKEERETNLWFSKVGLFYH